MLLTNSAALEALAFVALFQTTISSRIPALAPKHGNSNELHRRQLAQPPPDSFSIPSVSSTLSPAGIPTTYTIITPSPSASPIPITSQSQVVTTYVPILTLCPMSTRGAGIKPRSVAPYTNDTAPFGNTTGDGCVTKYSALRTTVCDTTINGIATQVHVTTCNQQVTFSSMFGYSLSTIAPTDTYEAGPLPTIETITTYFQAPWQAVTDGSTPTDIVQRVCSPVPTNSQQCVDIQEIWETIPISTVKTSFSHVDLITTISGPSIVSIETFHIDVTETLTEISLSTILVREYSTEHISTRRRVVGTITSTATDRTSTDTITVYPASKETSLPAASATASASAAASTANSRDVTTSTTTLQITRTTYISGTTTMTMQSASSVPLAEPQGLAAKAGKLFGK